LNLEPLLLATAVEAVLAAGDIQLQYFGGAMQVDMKGAIDLVTEVDVKIERMFRAMIASRFPEHFVLGEELQDGGGMGIPPGFCWVFDPIDGTTNFAHGLPIFAASLALEHGGRAVLGAVYDPTRRELFTAERGNGAFLNGVRLRVSAADTVLAGLLCTGFPYDVHESRDEIVGLFGEFVGRARAVRRLGSAALDLCYVAAGRFDGFWEQRLHPWDTSAAALIVQEAGGRVTRWDGKTFQSRDDNLVASNGHLHAEMLQIIEAFYARRGGNRTP
jgi:myo-inositol-1(or 4)-monophosphatase